jgi:hypothetical protein
MPSYIFIGFTIPLCNLVRARGGEAGVGEGDSSTRVEGGDVGAPDTVIVEDPGNIFCYSGDN